MGVQVSQARRHEGAASNAFALVGGECCLLAVVLLLCSGLVSALTLAPRAQPTSKASNVTSSTLAKAEQLRSAALALIKKCTRQDLTAAIEQLRLSADLFWAAGSRVGTATDYLTIGDVYISLSRYKKALRAYHFSLSLSAAKTDLRCSILSHIAIAYTTFGNLKSALRYAQEALAMSSPGAVSEKAEAAEAMGAALLYSDLERARDLFESTAQSFHNLGDLEEEARAAHYLGLALSSAGFITAALSKQEEALRLWASAGNIHGTAEAHSALGLLWMMRAEPDKALNEYQQAQPIFDISGDQDNEAIVFNGLGWVNRELGDYEKSRRYYRASWKIFAALADRFGEIGAIDGVARAEWGLHHYQKARLLYWMKLKRGQQARHFRVQASALSDLGDVYEKERRFAEAQRLYLRALSMCRSIRHTWAETDVLIRLGQLYAEIGRYPDAIQSLQRGLQLAEEAGAMARQAQLHYQLATVSHSLRQFKEAKVEAESATAIIESERVKVSDFESRATYFASVHAYYQLYIDILMQLHEQHPDQGFAEMALAAAEKGKVRSLLDMLASSKQKPDCDAGDKTTQQNFSNQSQKPNGCNVATALTPQQIQAAIKGDDAVLLEYSLGPEASYLWVVDEGHVSSYRLPAAQQILDLNTRFRNALLIRQSAPQQGIRPFLERVVRADQTINSTAQELSQMLLGPASALLTKKRLIIVPDGPLQYIPFAALPFPGAAGTANPPSLMDKYELTNLPSASVLNLLRDDAAKRAPPTKQAAIFADPVFSSNDPRLSTVSSANAAVHPPATALGAAMRDIQFGSGKIPRLKFSGIEAQNIADVFQNRDVFVARDFDASRDTVFSMDLRLYRYIHFATHGILDSKNPELSGLVLSLVDSHGKPQEGYLQLRDIYNLQLAADLVVLSSCNSALGKDLDSEGIIGLPRAFLYAGSQRVISTLWKVGDDATAEFMTHFYSRLHAGQNPSSALRGAQSDMAKSTEWQHPYYWAAFVLQGEYR